MKKPSMISVLLFLTGLLCIVSLFFFNKSTLERIITTEKDVDAVAEQIAAKQQQVKSAADKYTAAVDSVQANINRMKQKQQTASQKGKSRSRSGNRIQTFCIQSEQQSGGGGWL